MLMGYARPSPRQGSIIPDEVTAILRKCYFEKALTQKVSEQRVHDELMIAAFPDEKSNHLPLRDIKRWMSQFHQKQKKSGGMGDAIDAQRDAVLRQAQAEVNDKQEAQNVLALSRFSGLNVASMPVSSLNQSFAHGATMGGRPLPASVASASRGKSWSLQLD